MMRVMMFIMMVMVTMARGERMTITSVSEDLMVRRGESVNMTCQTDQVRIPSTAHHKPRRLASRHF